MDVSPQKDDLPNGKLVSLNLRSRHMPSKRRATTEITLSTTGPYIEKRSWKTVVQALLDYWPKPEEGKISRFLRIAIDDEDFIRASQISRKQAEFYGLHQSAMDDFHRLIDRIRSENPSPPSKIVLAIEGLPPSEKCVMKIFWQSRSLDLPVPSPADLDRLMILNERPRPVIAPNTEEAPQTIWV